MKPSRKFLLFIPVESRRSRRLLVVGYYACFLLFGALLVWIRGPEKYDRLLPLSFYAAAMLGGLSFSGPVRLFSEWQRKLHTTAAHGSDGSLGLLQTKYAAPLPGVDDRLDEYDIAARDRAHYLAYSALRWPAILAALVGGLFLLDWPPERLAHALLIASVPVAVLFFSLPQAILLWTEPDLDPDPVAQPQPATVRTVS